MSAIDRANEVAPAAEDDLDQAVETARRRIYTLIHKHVSENVIDAITSELDAMRIVIREQSVKPLRNGLVVAYFQIEAWEADAEKRSIEAEEKRSVESR